MKILSDKYDAANEKLKDLAANLLEQEKRMKAFQAALGKVTDETEQAVLVVELGKMMDEFQKRVEKM